jgi:cyclophilin family peptidyl-prolyl cis-trans isomerase/HEAT repeat protein
MRLFWIIVALAGGLGLNQSKKNDPPPEEPKPEEPPAEKPEPKPQGGLLGAKKPPVEATPAPAPIEPETLLQVPKATAEAIWKLELSRVNASQFALYIQDSDPKVRAMAAAAVGRLRQGVEAKGAPPTEALKLLEKAAADSSVEVRQAAAIGLGFTSGSEKILMARLGVETEAVVIESLIWAIGRQGSSEAIAPLLERANTGFFGNLAVAEALGRMGIRKVEGIGDSKIIAALEGMLGAPLGESRRMAAWAISRIGTETLSFEMSGKLKMRVLDDPDPLVRATLIRAIMAGSKPEGRVQLLKDLVLDPAPGVRIAAARAIGKYGCGEEPAVLSGLFSDPILSIRLEALAAVGSCKVESGPLQQALSTGKTDNTEKAALVRALGMLNALPEPLSWTLPAQPLLVRAAAIESNPDRVWLLNMALTGELPVLRSTAAGVLLEKPTSQELIGLLGASDEALVEAAADALKETPEPLAEPTLIKALQRKELQSSTVGACFRALSAIYLGGKVKNPNAAAKALVSGWLSTYPLLKKDAATLSGLLQIPLPEAPTLPIPSLAEILQIRSARIFTTAGEIRVALYPDTAPYTVWNFAQLSEKGLYDNLSFHRVVPEFVVQTGDPRGDGWGGPGYTIPDEVNPLPYTAGTLGMALSGPDTGGSQWFITLTPQPHLTGDYTAFGKVTLGMREASSLSQGSTLLGVKIERAPLPLY